MRSEKQRRVWTHNSFFGHARMMQVQAQAILQARTTTNKTKEVAYEIHCLAIKLASLLKDRVEIEDDKA